jgi:hypothetical protein
MSKTIISFKGSITFALLFILSLLSYQAKSQSTVFVSKDKDSGNANYYYAYNASDEELASIVEDRFYEKGYLKAKQVPTTIDTNKKGYGIVIQSFYTSESGKVVTVHGVAVGCKNFEDAKKRALENLQKNNPDWKTIASIKVVAKFEDK